MHQLVLERGSSVGTQRIGMVHRHVPLRQSIDQLLHGNVVTIAGNNSAMYPGTTVETT